MIDFIHDLGPIVHDFILDLLSTGILLLNVLFHHLTVTLFNIYIGISFYDFSIENHATIETIIIGLMVVDGTMFFGASASIANSIRYVSLMPIKSRSFSFGPIVIVIVDIDGDLVNFHIDFVEVILGLGDLSGAILFDLFKFGFLLDMGIKCFLDGLLVNEIVDFLYEVLGIHVVL